jgi:cytoskeleton protein RodZ
MNAPADTVGAQLRRERERQGMTLQKAADELRLDAVVIAALEGDAYEQTVPAVYARGHLRKYARLLGLNLDDAQLAPLPPGATQAPAAPLPPIASGARPMRVSSRAPRFPLAQLGLAAGILAVLLLFWWSPWKHRVAVQAAAPQPAPAVVSDDAASVPSVAGSAEDPGVTGPGELQNASALADPTPAPMESRPAQASPATQPTAVTPAPTAAESPAAPAADRPGDNGGEGHVSVRLTFTATSWVDVRDASGRRLFVGHGYVNTVRSLAGRAPLTVRVGYIDGVHVEINDRPVAIGRSLRSGDIGRFLAGADGLPHPLVSARP